MNNQRKNQLVQFVLIGVAMVVALAGAWFGVALPVPDLPEPLPTPTAVDLSGLASFEDLAQVQRQMETLGALGGESFSVSSDSTYNTDCYMTQGGGEFVADDGCEIGVLSGATLEVQSGGTLDVQAGAGITLAGYVTSTVDSLTVNGAGTITGNLVVSGTSDLVGNVSSSTGVVTVADGINVTGAADFDSTLDVDGAISSGTGAVTVTDGLNVTGAADFDSTVNVAGDLTVSGTCTGCSNTEIYAGTYPTATTAFAVYSTTHNLDSASAAGCSAYNSNTAEMLMCSAVNIANNDVLFTIAHPSTPTTGFTSTTTYYWVIE